MQAATAFLDEPPREVQVPTPITWALGSVLWVGGCGLCHFLLLNRDGLAHVAIASPSTLAVHVKALFIWAGVLLMKVRTVGQA